MFSKVIYLSLLLAVCHGGHLGHLGYSQGRATSSQEINIEHGIPSHELHDHHHHHHEENAYPRYQFRYSVTDEESGDEKSHSESRDGDSVQGEYSLVQPDGSTRRVTYRADDQNGFQADVSTTGGNQNLHDLHHPHHFEHVHNTLH